MEKAIIPAEKYRYELNEANKKLFEHDWFLVERGLSSDMKTVSTSSSDLTLTSHTNGNADVVSTDDLIEMRKVHEMKRQLTEDQVKKTKILIDDNINLRIK